MKVYEIFEGVEITPSATLGADGKPAGFNVIDTDNNRTIRTFPDAGSAEEFRDQERARRTPAQTPNTDPEPNTNTKPKKPSFKKRKQEIIKIINKYGRGSGWILNFLLAANAASSTWDAIYNYKYALQTSDCNKDEQLPALARNNLKKEATVTTTQFLATLTAGAAALKVLRMLAAPLALIPGAGWVAGAIAAGSSWLITIVIEKVLKSEKVLNFLSALIGDKVAYMVEQSCGISESIEEAQQRDAVLESLKGDASDVMKGVFAAVAKNEKGKQELVKVKQKLKSKAS